MSYNIRIQSVSGIPHFSKDFEVYPKNTSLKMRIYDYVSSKDTYEEPRPDQKFELEAGLVSALYEFSKRVGLPIQSLKYRAPKNNAIQINEDVELPEGSDILITARSEKYLNNANYQRKITNIFKSIVKNKLPSKFVMEFTREDEDYIHQMLTDQPAIRLLEDNKRKLKNCFKKILANYSSYGLESLAICSFDGNPLITYNAEKEEIQEILRGLGEIPQVKPTQWKYRLVGDKSLYIINSGVGPKISDIDMPFYYILITNEMSMLGDSPTTIYTQLNKVLNGK